MTSRRDWLKQTAAACGVMTGLTIGSDQNLKAQDQARKTAADRPLRIGVSTYSYWRYRKDSKLSIEDCIDLAAEAGFDAVEILHVQMEDTSPATLQRLKRRTFLHGPNLRDCSN